MKKIIFVCLLIATGLIAAFGETSGGISSYGTDELGFLVKRDLAASDQYRKRMADTIDFMKSRPDLFPASPSTGLRTLNREQKEIIWSTWQNFIDCVYAEDSIVRFYHEYRAVKDRDMRKKAFKTYYSAFLSQYRYALDFINIAENDRTLSVVLNDAVPEYGIKAGLYNSFKTAFLHVAKGTALVAGSVVNRSYGKTGDDAFDARIEDDRKYIMTIGQLKDISLTLQNAGTIISDTSFKLFFPVQAKFAELAGDIKVRRVHESLITQKQIVSEIVPSLLPGDFLIERREWYVSNVGLPGFWPHGALYIGTKDERKKFFGSDEETRAWVISQGESSGDFETLLATKYPAAYAEYSKPDAAGHSIRVIEAMSEGVVFTSAEHSAECDALGALRPKLSARLKAEAITRAFHYWNRPYDFNFDFLTDSSIVCTELLVKCFEKRETSPGLTFRYSSVLGRNVVSANDIIRQFDYEYGKDVSQFDFVLFYDGYEKGGYAARSTADVLRSSWSRPKWDIFLQKDPSGK